MPVIKHVFIVGLPRTGTKLVRNVLHRADDVCCRVSKETWFFGDLVRPGTRKQFSRFGDLSDNDNLSRLIDFMFEGVNGRSYWKDLQNGLMVDKAWMRRRMIDSERTEKAIFDVLMEATLAAAKLDCKKKPWLLGDKTPGHLYHVDKILEWYPQARIIHTFRDPRAIATSNWKRVCRARGVTDPYSTQGQLLGLLVSFYVTATWLYAATLHRRYSQKYHGNYLMSQYETLVNDPGRAIEDICNFVGIRFNADMMAIHVRGSSFSGVAKTGIDSSSVNRWKEHMPKFMEWFVTHLTKHRLTDFGYSP